MKTIYKKFTICYEFANTFWTNENMTIEAINIEQARQKVLNEIAKAYGSQILKEVKINT